jgi:hypothetical protein
MPSITALNAQLVAVVIFEMPNSADNLAGGLQVFPLQRYQAWGVVAEDWPIGVLSVPFHEL